MSARQQQQFSPAPSVTAAPPSLYCLSERATRWRSPSKERPPSLPRPPLRRGLLSSPPSLSAGRSLVPPSADGRGFCAPAFSPSPSISPSFPLAAVPVAAKSHFGLYTEKRARRGTFLSIYFHLLFICPSLFLFSLSMPLRVLQRGIAVLKLSLASRALPAPSDEKTEAVSESCEVTGTEQSPPL